MRQIISWVALGLLAFGGCSPPQNDSAGTCEIDETLPCQTGWVGYRCSDDATPSGNCGQPNATTSGFFSTEPGTYCCSTSGAGNPKCDGPIGCLAPQDCPTGMYCECAACGFYCGQCATAPECGNPNPLGYTLCDANGNCPNGGSCEMTSAGFKACVAFDMCTAPPAGGSGGGGSGGGSSATGGQTALGGSSGSGSGGSAGTVATATDGGAGGEGGVGAAGGEGD